ncbi:MAG: tRNA (guanosine(46)-N7)-methyltransferase TrmB, partial [Gammaproteobacteria bacterium]
IRSFVRREGRLTPAQARALERLLPRFGLPETGPWDPVAIFGREARVTLEIGFGNGEVLATLAAAAPREHFLGIEVHRPGVGRLLQRLEREGLTNVRVSTRDAVEALEHQVPEGSLDRVLIYFPDPWPKKRHHKRRLIQPPFVALLARALKPGGLLHLATDWMPYAEWMQAVLASSPDFEPVPPGGCIPRPPWRPETKFERRGRDLGHTVCDLLYRRRGVESDQNSDS